MDTRLHADATPPRRRRLWRSIVAAIALALAGVVAWLFGYEPPYRGSLVVRPSRPLVFAHRGFGDHAPDNSLYAVERAFEAGMDGVDVDGQLTRDGEIVIFHDLSVDRLTSASGRVRDKTREEMLALDLGPKHDIPMIGAYVRTFEDFVRTVKARGRGILMVELKVTGRAPTGIEERAVEIIRRYSAHENVVLSSFNPLVLYRLKRLDPQVRTALVFMDTNWNPESRYEHTVQREAVQGICDELDLPTCVYQTVDGPVEQAKKLQKWEDTQISIDSSAGVEEIARQCIVVMEAFVEIERAFDAADSKDLGAILHGILRTPDSAQAQIEQYNWGTAASLQITTRPDPARFAVTNTGYWIRNRLLQFPGVLLNPVAAASYLDVDVEAFRGTPGFQEPFREALYRGPFAGLGPYWWLAELEDILARLATGDDRTLPTGQVVLQRLGREAARARCCHDGHEGAGYYCIIRDEPVCAEHSVQPSGWLPMGADRCRIEQNKYDELSAWLNWAPSS